MPHVERQPAGTTEQTFVPASIPFEQSQRRVPLATRERPGQICGVALRVGRAGMSERDPPIYRLKISLLSFKSTVLPGYFVLERGMFIPCDQWRRRRRR